MTAALDYRRLFDDAPSPYLIMTADFTIVTVNTAYAEATMIDKEAVAGRHLFDVFPDNPDDPGADGVRNLRRSLQTVVDTRRPDAMPAQRYDVRDPEGGFVLRHWSPVNSPVLDDDGAVAYIIHRVQDVTELVESSRSRVEQMEADQRAKDRFIAVLSHELRNPLAAARAALDVLALDVPDHPARTVLDRQLTTLTRMTGDLLDAAHVISGRLRATRQPVDLTALVAAALRDTVAARPGRAAPVLTVPDDPVVVDGDPVRLTQMVTNLLDNAYTHTPPGTTVTVGLTGADGHARLAVHDRGPGFPPGSAPHLFDPFVRADTGGEAPEGLGLGLCVVRGIAELHDGTATAHSDGPGRGATFTVRMPLAATAGVRPPPAPAPPRPPLRILLIDDNADLAVMYQRLLRHGGDDVTIATTAAGALETAARSPFDLILCDLDLGAGPTGYDVVAHLRDSAAHRHTPVVAVSGLAEDTDGGRGRDAGFDAHLTKPLTVDTLDDLLAGWTHRWTRPLRRPQPGLISRGVVPSKEQTDE